MTKTMNHTNCAHPATKAGRSLCRKINAQIEVVDQLLREGIRNDYFAGTDAEDLIGRILALGIEVDPDADLEEVIASL